MQKLIVVVFTLFVMLGLRNDHVQGQQNPSRYAYLHRQLSGEVHLVNLDVSSSNIDAHEILLDVPLHSDIFDASTSPDHQWAVVAFAKTEHQSHLRLLNLTSGQISSVTDSNLFVASSVGFIANEYQNMQWSPDSRYVALNLEQDGRADIYIYDVQLQTLTNLTADDSDQYRAVWSSDAQYLITTSQYCDDVFDNSTCTLSLQKYHVATALLAASQDVSALFIGAGSVGSSICDLNLSPDMRYLSFTSSCDVIIPNRKELFIWDTNSNEVRQISSFTFDTAGATGIYDSLWFNDDTLLVGAIYANDGVTFYMQTFAYNPSTNTTNIIAANQALQNWVANPRNNTLGFYRITALEDFRSPTQTIQVGIYSIREIVINFTGNAGCNLSWSIDGSMLAYTTNGTSCLYSVETIGFADVATAHSQTYDPFLNSGINEVFPLGWVDLP